MMEIYLIRHGETNWNLNRKVQGRSDIPLNDYGIELAYKTKAGLEGDGVCFDAAYCSPLIRAVKTAQILLEGTGIEPVKDKRLEELDFGDFEGFSIEKAQTEPEYADFAKVFDEPASYVPRNGESFEELYERSRSFIKEVLLPLEGKRKCVLIAAHGALIRGIMNVIGDIPISDFWQSVQRNCAVNKMTLENGKFNIVYEGRIFYEEEHIYKNPADKD